MAVAETYRSRGVMSTCPQHLPHSFQLSCPSVRNTSPINFNPVFGGIDRLPRR
jgi:hypothetical protein